MKPGKEGLDVEPGGKPPPVLEKLELSSELEDAESRTTSRGQKEPCQSMLQLLKRHPLSLCGPPVVLFCLVVALCVFGLTFAIDAKIETQKKLAHHVARDTADALVLQLNVVSGAALTLAAFVKRDPDWNRLQAEFIPVAQEVFRQAAESSSYDLAELQYIPFGKISTSYSEVNPRNVSTDLFRPDRLERTQVYQTLEMGSMTINGPLPLTVGGRQALIARYPVFIEDVDEDEDWNNPNNQTRPTGCTDRCYNETTRTKFWGFTAAFFYAASILSGEDQRLQKLVKDGYVYRLSKIDGSANKHEVIVENGFNGKKTASVQVEVPGSGWQLCVYTDEIDDTKDMRDGLIAMIVIVALILSGLLLLLLVSHQKAAMLLEEQLITNKVLEQTNNRLTETKCVLEAEKQQREALLGRQYDLIACFEQRGSKQNHSSGRGSDISGSLSSSMADKQQATLGRIAAVRRAIDEDRGQAPHPNDDIRTFELLGEGTFGKVHRGLWRQTVVAIKIILLPANMSGAEKREKMVVWEAAISSSLSHPNIVQTYTYSIKPVKESRDRTRVSLEDKELGSAVVFPEEPPRANAQGSLLHKSSDGTSSSGGGAIHSFEVQLVLEYCDKGCLRDALDQGVFLDPNGLNYPAILDSAEDIARAMLHLHCNNVLHMDLKARNVMLASSGTEGRGVSCKIADFGLAVRIGLTETMDLKARNVMLASSGTEGRGVNCKVADFGLAVRIGLTETHVSGCFQGTVTHMAPEVLLEGRVSKAADVYAFGITLWELFTAGQPYKGVPKALLGHRVVKEQRRPALPLVMPEGYRELLNKCWSHKPEHRPMFSEILGCLRELRSALPFPTPTMSKLAKLDAHPVRANVLQKLAEDARIDEGGEEEEDNQEGSAAAMASAQGGKALPQKQCETGLSKKSEEATHLMGVKAQGWQRRPWLKLGGTGHFGDRGKDSGGGGGGAGGVGNTKEGSRHEGLAFPGAVVLDMREVTGGVRGVDDRPSCSGVDGVRGAVGKQGGGRPPADGHEREGPPSGGVAARRKSYPGPQRSESFTEQQQQQAPAEQSDKDPTQLSADTHMSDPGLMWDNPNTSKPFSFSLSRTPSRTHSSSSSRHLRRSHSSRSRSSHNCVLVIGEDSDEMYPENSRGQGEGEGCAQSLTSTKIEVSGMRSKAAFGYMLEPIGEERCEGPSSTEPKRPSTQERA
eukprot:CAMPEP_0202421856 /NCGR_PEP_ID=MMETSP1128-20130828/50555_1 /ASSEMBLY_ACC=CAM_ASM_000463 /TAXON_ID=3047 /ORGANISM="Dunaliella tertiolecta, Strain CCMP1320" /LENGTH=1194 /DNA_ID=CAMNT_0049029899 /DNA_START=159 /DNA_END=3743 /DNA_ORIENTATION=+